MFASKDIFLTPPSGGYTIARSVRLRSSASAYLNRTFGTPTSTTIWTASAWVKRGSISGYNPIFCTSGSGANFTGVIFDSSTAKISLYWNNSGTPIQSSAVFRDPSAWYHLVWKQNGTSTDIYINNINVLSTTVSGTSTEFNQNTKTGQIGANTGNSIYHDGYLTEINFIDGQALTPSSFGSTNAITGVWQPAKYTGTYGTNGFYLNFSDNSNNTAATIGKDYSGNGNNWTPNNISVTAGVTYDSMVDSPTVGATSSNYAVANPLNNTAGYLTISGGNLNVSCGGADKLAFGTFAIPTSGKWYFEYLVSSTGSATQVGLGDNTQSQSSGTGFSGGSQKFGSGGSWANSDIAGVAIDMDAGTGTIYKNNSSYLSLTSLSGTTWYPCVYINSASGSFNFGQRPFSYTPPTGFIALNTYNLPASTITNGAAYMAATTYTGTGVTGRAVSNAVNGVSMQPDLVWVKSRSSATYNELYDSVRGVSLRLFSNDTAAEVSYAPYGVTAFSSGGFSVSDVTSSGYGVNENGVSYIGWQWKAGGTSASNTNGSITSTVSVGATQGFSVVTYTGTGANATVGHGLGVAPSMIIVKSRSTAGTDWPVYHSSLGATGILALDATIAFTVISTPWNNTAPTSSVFSVGTSGDTNFSARTYVAYCFAAVAGYSAFGSYVGNSSSDGPFLYTGFRPRFVMLKNSSAASNWTIFDTTRNPYNFVNLELEANLSNAESDTTASYSLDILSNGFKIRAVGGTNNTSGQSVIYACWAENPFRNALAR